MIFGCNYRQASCRKASGASWKRLRKNVDAGGFIIRRCVIRPARIMRDGEFLFALAGGTLTR